MKLLKKSYAFIFLVLLIACSEAIQLDFESGQTRLIVDGVLTDQNKDHYVHLSLTSDYLENEPNKPVSGAQLLLSDASREISLPELENRPGTYVISKDFPALVGEEYRLTIRNVDVDEDGHAEIYEASNVMNSVPPIHSLDLSWDESRGRKRWKVLLSMTDPKEKQNFYAFALYVNNELITNKLSDLGYADDEFFNGNEINRVWVHSVVEENEDGEIEIELKEADEVKLEMQGIDETYYDFLEAVDEETGLKVPLFSGPPANVPSNISNGAVGFFRAYSVSCSSVLVSREILNQKTNENRN